MTHTIEQTADAILSLINSKPRSPTKDDLISIITANLMETASSPAQRWQDTPMGREWLTLEGEKFWAVEALPEDSDDPNEAAAAAANNAASDRLDACVLRIWA